MNAANWNALTQAQRAEALTTPEVGSIYTKFSLTTAIVNFISQRPFGALKPRWAVVVAALPAPRVAPLKLSGNMIATPHADALALIDKSMQVADATHDALKPSAMSASRVIVKLLAANGYGDCAILLRDNCNDEVQVTPMIWVRILDSGRKFAVYASTMKRDARIRPVGQIESHLMLDIGDARAQLELIKSYVSPQEAAIKKIDAALLAMRVATIALLQANVSMPSAGPDSKTVTELDALAVDALAALEVIRTSR